MPSKAITIEANSDMELLTKITALQEIAKLPADQLKRLAKLSKSEKARKHLASDAKLAVAMSFL